ncbi:hypothetical protein EVAR_738_1 [Eumeta japonica]|uniref:Uncharacterized protein n=1 Tax=Eumeta variegata TaxID=151549 RepID=A0A4C1SER7_EUMVA|nr:hypothetical protein EVAR_738_1 [Eumeta japonica]
MPAQSDAEGGFRCQNPSDASTRRMNAYTRSHTNNNVDDDDDGYNDDSGADRGIDANVNNSGIENDDIVITIFL